MIIVVTRLEIKTQDPQKLRDFGGLLGGSFKDARAYQDGGGFSTPGLASLEFYREGNTYWTYTAWNSKADLDNFMRNSKTHNEAVQRSSEFGETTTQHWSSEGKLPFWNEARKKFTDLTSQSPEGSSISVERK